MNEDLIYRCMDFTGPMEGNILWPYRDNAVSGNATVGRGHLLYSAGYAANVFGVPIETLQPQWDDLMKARGGQVASFYETITDLRISPEKSDAMFRSDIDCHIENCRRVIPGFDSLPTAVCIACVDIDFNVRGEVGTFVEMLKAISQRDWASVARESDRPQLRNRSAATKALIDSVPIGS